MWNTQSWLLTLVHRLGVHDDRVPAVPVGRGEVGRGRYQQDQAHRLWMGRPREANLR